MPEGAELPQWVKQMERTGLKPGVQLIAAVEPPRDACNGRRLSRHKNATDIAAALELHLGPATLVLLTFSLKWVLFGFRTHAGDIMLLKVCPQHPRPPCPNLFRQIVAFELRCATGDSLFSSVLSYSRGRMASPGRRISKRGGFVVREDHAVVDGAQRYVNC